VALSAVDGIKRHLDDPEDVLKQIGGILLAQAQLAFTEQRLGAVAWKRRYPSQKPPLLNIAGALEDFRGGRSEQPRLRWGLSSPMPGSSRQAESPASL
jgi:hypothetical protein